MNYDYNKNFRLYKFQAIENFLWITRRAIVGKIIRLGTMYTVTKLNYFLLLYMYWWQNQVASVDCIITYTYLHLLSPILIESGAKVQKTTYIQLVDFFWFSWIQIIAHCQKSDSAVIPKCIETLIFTFRLAGTIRGKL